MSRLKSWHGCRQQHTCEAGAIWMCPHVLLEGREFLATHVCKHAERVIERDDVVHIVDIHWAWGWRCVGVCEVICGSQEGGEECSVNSNTSQLGKVSIEGETILRGSNMRNACTNTCLCTAHRGDNIGQS